ncbi:MAG TPA: TolC family protein [Bryobacteraceae bacterium]|jgi:outer membrane protein TolC
MKALLRITGGVARAAVLLGFAAPALVLAQNPAPSSITAADAAIAPDYSAAAKVFPNIIKPYVNRYVPEPNLSNAANVPLEVQDGKLRLSLAQVAAAVVQNNLTVAGARYYPAAAQTDLLRARSGQSPRGVDQSSIPSGVFAGATGSSILGSAGGGGGGASNAGGITGSASQVNVGPSGVFDPSFNVSFSLDRTPSPLNTLIVAGVPQVTTHTAAASVRYNQAFPSGTSISASFGFQRQSSTQLHLLFDPAFTPGFTFTVAQQLMNGFGYKVNRALIKVAENEQGIEREAFREQVITALASAEDAYYDLISARESVRTAEQALTVSQQLYQNNLRAFDAGVMARLDVVNAQAQVAASDRDLVIAQTNLQYAELTLKSMISVNLEEPFESASIDTTDSFPEPDTDKLPSLQEAVAIAQKNRPEISIADGNIKSEQDVMPFLDNALLPNVNVFGLVNTAGLYNVLGNAFVDNFDFKYPQFAVGLSISFPVRNRQAQADEVRSRLELKQSQDTLVRTKSQIEVDVQNALIGVTLGRAQVNAARGAVRTNEQKTDAEKKRLTAGLSTSYNVILVERDLFAAQLAEVQARDTYAKAKVALDQAMGITLDTNHINLDEALKGSLKTAPGIQ